MSKNNNPCIGVCSRYTEYKKNDMIHPFYIQTIDNEKLNPDDNVCPVLSYKDDNDNEQNMDKCNEISNLSEIDINYNIFRANYLVYSYESLLKNIYNIYTFTDTLEYIANTSNSFTARQRVLHLAEKVYVFNVLHDNIFYVNFFVESLHYYYQTMYIFLYPYVGYVDDMILFVYPENNTLKKNEYIKERIQYMTDKLISFNNVQSFLKSIDVVKDSKEGRIISINKYIDQYLSEYCVNKIMMSLNKK